MARSRRFSGVGFEHRLIEIQGQAVVHGGEPIGLGQGLALRLRDRHQGQLVELSIQLGAVRGRQGTMQGVEVGHRQPPHQGVVACPRVEVQHVEAIELVHQLVQLDQFRHGGVAVVTRQAQGLGHAGEQLGAGAGIAAGEQHHGMAAPHQLFGEVMHHPFGAAVALGRDALAERGNLGNAHHLREQRGAAAGVMRNISVLERVWRRAAAESVADGPRGAALRWFVSRTGHP
jgi:hypothetical protein